MSIRFDAVGIWALGSGLLGEWSTRPGPCIVFYETDVSLAYQSAFNNRRLTKCLTIDTVAIETLRL